MSKPLRTSPVDLDCAKRSTALAEVAIHRDEKSGHYIPDRKFVGADPAVLGEAIGVSVPAGTIRIGFSSIGAWLPFFNRCTVPVSAIPSGRFGASAFRR